MAIGINVSEYDESKEYAVSKFFGSPCVPAGLTDDIGDEYIMLAQIKLSVIAEYDKENRLPHTGWLYIFVDTEGHHYPPLLKYSKEEPTVVIDDFNDISEEYRKFTKAWKMDFCEVPDDEEGNKLLGLPAMWPYEELPEKKLLLSYDPLSSDMGFMSWADGMYYILTDSLETFEGAESFLEYT